MFQRIECLKKKSAQTETNFKHLLQLNAQQVFITIKKFNCQNYFIIICTIL